MNFEWQSSRFSNISNLDRTHFVFALLIGYYGAVMKWLFTVAFMTGRVSAAAFLSYIFVKHMKCFTSRYRLGVYHRNMMTSSNGNIFRVTGSVWGESTGDRWISPHKGQWRGYLVFSMMCARTNGLANYRDAGELVSTGKSNPGIAVIRQLNETL